MKTKKLWIGFILIMVVSFGILGFFGREIYREAPPIPEKVISTDGTILFEGSDIKDGQNVWQSMGGQEVGTIWGHGAYKAPDWTADWLHRWSLWALRLTTTSNSVAPKSGWQPINGRSTFSLRWPSGTSSAPAFSDS
jgi:nitric oxide reductase large subunit